MDGNQRLEEETLEDFNSFINSMDGLCPNQFKSVHMNSNLFVKDLLTLSFVLYDVDFVQGNVFRELARRSVQKYENTVRLMRYNKLTCYFSNVFKRLLISSLPQLKHFVEENLRIGVIFIYKQ